MRISLAYYDQNERFAACLPRAGTVTRRVPLKGWGDDWYLLNLDEPFEYEGRRHDQVLIRSRWEGYRVGGWKPTSVFILLIPNAAALAPPTPRPKEFHHVAWGMARTVGPWWKRLAAIWARQSPSIAMSQ